MWLLSGNFIKTMLRVLNVVILLLRKKLPFFVFILFLDSAISGSIFISRFLV
nr:hypothetical protein Itr_chr13CG17930 [Ipomoea trifida]